MKPAPSGSPAPAAPRRRFRIGSWLLIVLGICGYGAWREYDFRAAVKEANLLGWEWTYDDPIEAIQKDRTAAFRKATWFAGKRELHISVSAGQNDLDPHADVARRLRPTALWIIERTSEARSTLEGLTLRKALYQPEINDADRIKRLAMLGPLDLDRCTGLTNVNALGALTTLQSIDLTACTTLTNIDGLKGLSALQSLDLSGCAGLTNVHGLKGLTTLRRLDISYCTELRNVDALKGLTALK